MQFIEPYLKSKALTLHDDAITQAAEGWEPPSAARQQAAPGRPRVLFHHYTGAAPRLYRRAFAKDGEVKDPKFGKYTPGPLPRMLTDVPVEHGFAALETQIAAKFRAALPTFARPTAGAVGGDAQ